MQNYQAQIDTTKAPIRRKIIECLVEGLAFLHCELPPDAQALARRVLANIIVEHLDVSGFVVQGKPVIYGAENSLDVG